MFRRLALALAAVSLMGQDPQEPPTVTFGTTVAISSGLQGDLYMLEPGTQELPSFKRKNSIGTIYTTSLQLWPRLFDQGFPGITDRFEWFAIDYNGRFWMERPGVYKFRLLSDDGSKLFIDGKMLIDNDGLHEPTTVEGQAEFTRGVHQIRVQYFQGPRIRVALVLSILGPGEEEWKIFDTNQFQPPPDPREWVDGKISKIKRGYGQ